MDYFNTAVEKYTEETQEEPSLISKYEGEIPLLLEEIAAYECKVERLNTAKHNIVNAVMSISDRRVADIRETGWVCGTYMRKVRMYFENWLQNTFSEEELTALVNSIKSGKELTQKQMQMVMLFLHNTPKTLVHPRMSRIMALIEEKEKNENSSSDT